MENYSEMSNTELKLCLETLTQEFESKKAELISICESMDKIEKKYKKLLKTTVPQVLPLGRI